MHHTFSHGIIFGILGAGVGVLAGSFVIPGSTPKDAYWGLFLGCGIGLIFGAILGLSQTVDELRDRLETDPGIEPRRTPPLGGMVLPRFGESSAKPPSTPMLDEVEPPFENET